MNKNTIIYIVAAIIIIGGIAAFTMSRSGQPAPGGSTATQSENQQTARESGSGLATGKVSMKDLLISGKSQKCTFTQTASGSQSSGTVYIADGKIRGDFESAASAAGGTNMQSHMITDGNTSYVWTSGMSQGFKMSTVQSAPSGSAQKQAVDYNQALDYACAPWNPDQSMFMLPQGITFTDMNAMMRDIPSGLPTGR